MFICGSNKEQYDFFHIYRYHISHLFKSMWENPIHRQAVICESRQGNQFVKFVNMLMNDTTFLLDECLENLKRIHLTQQLMSDIQNWSGMSAEQQQSRLTQLATDERQCRSYLTLARETVDLFHYLTVSLIKRSVPISINQLIFYVYAERHQGAFHAGRVGGSIKFDAKF